MVVLGSCTYHRFAWFRSTHRHSKQPCFALNETSDGWSSWIEKNPLPSRQHSSNGWGGWSANSDKKLQNVSHQKPPSTFHTSSAGTKCVHFSAGDTADILAKHGQQHGISWVEEEQRWMAQSQQCEILLPRILDKPAAGMSWQEYTSTLQNKGLGRQLLVFVSAESVAMGLIIESSLCKHKVLKGYTVRKSQGRAQLTHERRKDGGGHGSAGGAIRAKETRRLFESVASRLLEWSPDIDLCNKLFWHGGVRVWNEVYSKDQTKRGMVARRDRRWEKVGFSIRRPKYADLCWISKELTRGTVVLSSDVKDVAEGAWE